MGLCLGILRCNDFLNLLNDGLEPFNEAEGANCGDPTLVEVDETEREWSFW